MVMEPVTLQNGTMMYIDELDSLELARKGIYEPVETAFIESFIKEDIICVDIGANIGYYTLLMAKKAGIVYTFEPDRNNYQTLLDNISINGAWRNIRTFPYAIGPVDDDIILHICSENNGMHRIYESKWCNSGKELVQMYRLDSMIETADFIKIDVEGAEFGVLSGMTHILEDSRPPPPTILMEFNIPSIIEYGIDPKALFNWIQNNLDYDISFPDRPLTWDELNDLATKWGGINIVCTPREK